VSFDDYAILLAAPRPQAVEETSTTTPTETTAPTEPTEPPTTPAP
jgi:hypothetical protein